MKNILFLLNLIIAFSAYGQIEAPRLNDSIIHVTRSNQAQLVEINDDSPGFYRNEDGSLSFTEYSINPELPGIEVNPNGYRYLSFTDELPEGDYSIQLIAENDSGSDTAILDIKVYPGYMVDVAGQLQNINMTQGEYYTEGFYYASDGMDSKPTKIEVTDGNAPPGITFNPGVNSLGIDGMPEESGEYVFNLILSTSYASSQIPVKITVHPGTAPVYESDTAELVFGEGSDLEYESRATRIELASSLQLTSNYESGYSGQLPPGLEITFTNYGAIFSGTPIKAGSYSIIITTVNDYGSDSIDVDILVEEGIAPIFQLDKKTFSLPVNTKIESSGYNFDYIIQPSNGSTVTSPIQWSISGSQPRGIIREINDGGTFFVPSIIFTGVVSQAGEWVQEITASNGYGSDTITITWQIYDNDPELALPTPLRDSFDAGNNYYYSAWFGVFFKDADPENSFLYSENIGWTWVAPGDSATDFWMYNFAFDGWLWTSSLTPGAYFSASIGDWVYIIREQGVTYINRPSTGEWSILQP